MKSTEKRQRQRPTHHTDKPRLSLQIQYVDPATLIPDPQNPRIASTSTILALARSLDRWGWTRPILAEKNSRIIVFGHQILKAAQLRKHKKVPVVFKEFTEEERKAYNIADNKLSELSTWDESKLIRLLEEIHETVPLDVLGFSKEELDALGPDLTANIESLEEQLRGETTDILSPLTWFGGKSHLASWIIYHFPQHQCYVEVFGGSAAVLLRKPPSKIEVYNDLNKFVCEFFKCLRDHSPELMARLVFMPYSRQLYNYFKEKGDNNEWPSDLVTRSAMWFFMQRTAFSGVYGAGWRHGKAKNPASTYSKILTHLFKAAGRLRRVQIEQRDFRDIFKTYDTGDTLFYVDPPYAGIEDRYQESIFTMEDHKDLARIVHTVQGKVCISYYEHPFVDKIYKDWRRVEKQTYAWAAMARVHREPRTELLLMNY